MQYDAIIIGAGQAGPGVAAHFAAEGQKVALIEGDRLGGTCLNHGCRPTKTLRMSARAAHMARRAAEYGVNVGPIEVDFAAVMARKDRIIGGMQEGTDKYFHSLDNVDVIYTYGHFLEPENGLFRVQVGDDVISADRVYINTGARATIPPIDGINAVTYMTNVELLQLDRLPDHLIIVGGSYIGLEFGQMFRRFGSQVTIIEAGQHIAAREDADIAASITELLETEDIRLITNSHATAAIQAADGTITVTVVVHPPLGGGGQLIPIITDDDKVTITEAPTRITEGAAITQL